MSARFRRCFAILVLIFSGAIAAPAAFAETTYTFNLPEQSLADSLRAIGQQTEMNILFEPEAVKNARSPALRGQYTVDEAIRIVLAGTKLEAQHTAASNVVIKVKSTRSTAAPAISADPPASSGARLAQSSTASLQSQSATGPQNTDTSNPTSESSRKEGLSEIVVTGTHIRGVAPLSPVKTITNQDLVDQGYSRLDEAVQGLPENFGDGSSVQSNGTLGIGHASGTNSTFGTSVNLFGLGAGTTLILLNGQRLAPTGAGSHVDISGIPTSVIDRVEILEDGASAIYGSDAIGGVVNIITRKDYDGVETGGRITSISKGKTPNYGGYALAGTSWATGNFVANFDYEKDNPLLADSRSFTAGLLGPLDLLPQNQNYRFYVAGRQEITDQLTVSAQALVPYREFASYSNDGATGQGVVSQLGSELQPSAAIALAYDFAPGWQASLSGEFSLDRNQLQSGFSAFGETGLYGQRSKSTTAEGRIGGPLFQLPGGSAQLALGGQFRSESFLYTQGVVAGTAFYPEPTEADHRTDDSVYGELLLPLIGEDNAVPLVRELAIDVAGRFDHYSDFGSSTNPKATLKWVPAPGLTVHGTYTTSFRAPTFDELLEMQIIEVYGQTDPMSPSGVSRAILLDGGNPNLGPERSKSFNAGLAYSPPSATGLGASFSYFHFDYTQRIERIALAAPWGLAGFLANASALGSLITVNPTPAQVAAAYASVSPANIYLYPVPAGTPDTIVAIAHASYENAAASLVSGVNGDLHYDTKTPMGDFRATIDGTYLTKSEQQLTPNSQPYTLLNTLAGPLKFRGKGMLNWKWQGWAAYGRVNYANPYHNSTDPSCGPVGCPIASWTTFDMGLSWSTTPSVDHRLLSGLRVGLDVVNVFDREPPFALSPGTAYNYLPYDPINANPLQRAFALTIIKKW
jgi:iron complex outermembrane receptor protein